MNGTPPLQQTQPNISPTTGNGISAKKEAKKRKQSNPTPTDAIATFWKTNYTVSMQHKLKFQNIYELYLGLTTSSHVDFRKFASISGHLGYKAMKKVNELMGPGTITVSPISEESTLHHQEIDPTNQPVTTPSVNKGMGKKKKDDTSPHHRDELRQFWHANYDLNNPIRELPAHEIYHMVSREVL